MPHASLPQLIQDLANLTAQAAKVMAQPGQATPLALGELESAMGNVIASCAHVRDQMGLNGQNVTAQADQSLARLQAHEPPRPEQRARRSARPDSKPRRHGAK